MKAKKKATRFADITPAALTSKHSIKQHELATFNKYPQLLVSRYIYFIRTPAINEAMRQGSIQDLTPYKLYKIESLHCTTTCGDFEINGTYQVRIRDDAGDLISPLLSDKLVTSHLGNRTNFRLYSRQDTIAAERKKQQSYRGRPFSMLPAYQQRMFRKYPALLLQRTVYFDTHLKAVRKALEAGDIIDLTSYKQYPIEKLEWSGIVRVLDDVGYDMPAILHKPSVFLEYLTYFYLSNKDAKLK